MVKRGGGVYLAVNAGDSRKLHLLRCRGGAVHGFVEHLYRKLETRLHAGPLLEVRLEQRLTRLLNTTLGTHHTQTE